VLNIEKILTEKKYKKTPARVAILDIFNKSNKPISAEEISLKLKTKKQKIDAVTIYRTLASFEKAGILKRVDLRKESIFFELNVDHHHHLICTNCNLIERFRSEDAEKSLEKIIKESSNFKIITEHSFELFGLCQQCSK
jgi:Fe2+ or Zn2+ uptake regulation protein